MLDILIVRFIADLFDWPEIDYQAANQMVSFKKNGSRINIYLTTGTVATALKHPTKGKTQLYRRKISTKQLARIFADPRVHTGKGYYKCPNGPKFSTIS